ncbi:MAG: hypothetical protein AB7I25_03205 [Vicinamibacterales bacterium]
MRRLSGLLLAGALMMLPVFSQSHVRAAEQAAQKFTFDGDTALWTVAIKPDKTADFEKLMGKVKEALLKLERKAQADGWKIVKSPKAMPDGNIPYIHVISPVVKDADYTVMAILYEANTDPTVQRELYDLYRGAFAANLGAAGYSTVNLGQ